MGYKMKRGKKSPFNFGEGTGRSPLNNGENEPGKGRSWDNPEGPHIEKQKEHYKKSMAHGDEEGGGHNINKETAAKRSDLPASRANDNPPPASAKPKGTKGMRRGLENQPPGDSPFNRVMGQGVNPNPSVEVPHVEHGTGMGVRTGKGIKRKHTQ